MARVLREKQIPGPWKHETSRQIIFLHRLPFPDTSRKMPMPRHSIFPTRPKHLPSLWPSLPPSWVVLPSRRALLPMHRAFLPMRSRINSAPPDKENRGFRRCRRYLAMIRPPGAKQSPGIRNFRRPVHRSLAVLPCSARSGHRVRSADPSARLVSGNTWRPARLIMLSKFPPK